MGTGGDKKGAQKQAAPGTVLAYFVFLSCDFSASIFKILKVICNVVFV